MKICRIKLDLSLFIEFSMFLFDVKHADNAAIIIKFVENYEKSSQIRVYYFIDISMTYIERATQLYHILSLYYL